MQIDSPMIVIGTRPLILFATTNLVATAAIDAASHFDKPNGAGANDADCTTAGIDGADSGTGAGGGAGGRLGDPGGAGAPGGVGTLPGLPGGIVVAPTIVRGGCRGGAGGHGIGNGGAAGAGGGAIYLVAGARIDITSINASGAGANQGPESK